ncbi:coatomer subunit beta-1-like [Trifolium medium]|uniref:Coatomer subunit beta-1-like n=1 Tax=Trifolium medium TaxID=97028 RepID=A0A392QTZ7_9FABA|nr:coatomer subunit beta-1-like [Trifolium medium]
MRFRTTGEFTKDADDSNKLNHILQVIGLGDPVYAEAYATVHHYDNVLDVTVINRTKETLQNLCLALATMGDVISDLLSVHKTILWIQNQGKRLRANIKENIYCSKWHPY